jgi:hypothetical protein
LTGKIPVSRRAGAEGGAGRGAAKVGQGRGWRTADVLGRGSPHRPSGAARTDLAEDDLDALIGVYADASKGLFRRLDQIDQLLDLMRLDLNAEADVDEYAERIALGVPSCGLPRLASQSTTCNANEGIQVLNSSITRRSRPV